MGFSGLPHPQCIPPIKRNLLPGKRLTALEKAKIRKYRSEGWGIAEIQRELRGRAYTTIERYVRGLGASSVLPDSQRASEFEAAAEKYLAENPPPKITIGELSTAALAALRDFEVFCDRYEGVRLVPHQREWIHHILSGPRKAIFGPPSSGKSFVFSVFLPTWLLCGGGYPPEYYQNPENPLRNRQIVLVSKIQDMALKNFLAIEARLTQNQKLIQDFGRFKDLDLPWQVSRGALIVAGRDRLKLTGDFSLVCVGAKGAILGRRATDIILDDVADLDTVASETDGQKLQKWVANRVFTRLQRGGRILAFQQRLPIPNDFSVWIESLGDEEAERKTFSVMISPAVKDWDTKQTLWPKDHEEFPSWEEIQTQKDILRDDFEVVYQQTPYKGTYASIRREWIYGDDGYPGCLDRDRQIGETAPFYWEGQEMPKIRVVSFDSSPTKFSGVLCMDIPRLPRPVYNPILLDIYRGRMNAISMRRLMYDWWEKYHFKVLIFETVASETLYLNDEPWQEFRRKTRVRVIEQKTHHVNKSHELYGKQTVADDVEAGRIRIPFAGMKERTEFNILIKELLEEVSTDDTYMSLWFPKNHLAGLMTTGIDTTQIRGYGRPHIPPPPRLLPKELNVTVR